MKIHVGIDVGGTFTDIAIRIQDGDRLILHKVPSSPDEPERAIIEGLTAVLAENGLDPASIVRLSHGTTVGTNALIERRCGTVAIVTTEGFRDLLEIARQTRPKVYDIHLDHPPPLVPRRHRYEVAERRRADGVAHRPLDEAAVRALGDRLRAQPIDCVVVCFLHAYRYPEHEQRAVRILRACLPDHVHVICSSDVYPEFREYERLSTTVLNGALLTVMRRYLDRLSRSLGAVGIVAEPKISQSAGGLMSIARALELPIAASLSGPAAGALGAAHVAATASFTDIITLDVGGTSADVSLLKGGRPTEVQERLLAGFPLRLPALDINAVGAGGGSIAWVDRDGLLKVGPRSAGARPGPACYGLGGTEATVTDANVVLGRLNNEALLGGRMPIDAGLARRAIEVVAHRIGVDPIETALGIVRVACATIVKAIRSVSLERGQDPAAFSLFAFGGAGPLHATEIARELDIRTVIVPPDPGILCAEGLLVSDLTADFVRTVLLPLTEAAAETIAAVHDILAIQITAWFERERITPSARMITWSVDLRYRGQNFELAIPLADAVIDGSTCGRLVADFHLAHEQAYGFASTSEPVEIVSVRAKARGVLDKPALHRLSGDARPQPIAHRSVVFDQGRPISTPIYRRSLLSPGATIVGPAIFEQLDCTSILFPGDSCAVDPYGNLVFALAGGEGCH